jgi:hypothetical protein
MKMYEYVSTAGYPATVPATLHKMIQRGVSINGVNGGLLTKQCQFVEMTLAGGTRVTAAVLDKKVTVLKVSKPKSKPVAKKAKSKKTVKKQAVTIKAPKDPNKKSNGQLCREYIAVVKANGGTLDDVIKYGLDVLKQNKYMAKSCAVFNWDRV